MALAVGRMRVALSTIERWIEHGAAQAQARASLAATAIELRWAIASAARELASEAALACGSRPLARGRPCAASGLGIDVSERALCRPARLRGVAGVTLARATFPEQMQSGRWDLIVCSEVLYYLDPPAFVLALERVRAGLADGATVLAVHWQGATETYPLRGDEVHDRLAEQFAAWRVLDDRQAEIPAQPVRDPMTESGGIVVVGLRQAGLAAIRGYRDAGGKGAVTLVWYTQDGVLVGVLTHERDGDYERGRELIARGRDAVTVAVPDPRLRAVVVVPARDERERIGACLDALARQRGVAPEAFEVILVLDHCRDDTHARALSAAAAHPRAVADHAESEQSGAGHARRIGMDLACARLFDVGILTA